MAKSIELMLRNIGVGREGKDLEVACEEIYLKQKQAGSLGEV